MKGDIWNTICPVCGDSVPNDMPLIDLARTSVPYQRDGAERPGLRLCSTPCATIAQNNPEKYRALAVVNGVEDGPKRAAASHTQ